ncbi:hypothetical protein DHEL01_v209896 [Diaporthe helianthi]|uniref:Uncharacterized protein n=1 Tax=Diaporthe helianthi TaxID=158607 RepID=A0A2P5HNA6_DIAHE|nr:hypothetical protein DHEL01_v209896 [Diaporthe helianthi]
MAGTARNDTAQHYGLTPREVELIIKAMITVLESGGKPDFEKLAQMTHYNTPEIARNNWKFVKTKLMKAAGSRSEAKGNENTAGETPGKKRGKRQAVDASAVPDAKRSYVRKSGNGGEEKASHVKAEEDESLEGEA